MRQQTLRYALLPVDVEEIDEDQMRQALDEGFIARVSMPENALLLPQVAFSTKGITLYAVGSPDSAESQEREFYVVGNGRDLPEHIEDAQQAADSYIGTAKIPGGPTAHVFELVKAAV